MLGITLPDAITAAPGDGGTVNLLVLAFTGFDAANLHPFTPKGFDGIVTAGSVVFFADIGFDAIST